MRGALFRRWLRWTAKSLGITVGASVALTSLPSAAQDVGYRASETAPIAWREFALKVRARFHERLSADDEVMREFHRRLEEKVAATRDAQFVTLRVWVTPAGSVEYLEADGLDNDMTVSLRGILIRQEIGLRPPPDLLQPLHLKLSLSRRN